nr:MAG TPA: hypothetical protein [Caudoviricetes sp.]
MNRSNNLQFLQVANRERYACLSYKKILLVIMF